MGLWGPGVRAFSETPKSDAARSCIIRCRGGAGAVGSIGAYPRAYRNCPALPACRLQSLHWSPQRGNDGRAAPHAPQGPAPGPCPRPGHWAPCCPFCPPAGRRFGTACSSTLFCRGHPREVGTGGDSRSRLLQPTSAYLRDGKPLFFKRNANLCTTQNTLYSMTGRHQRP